MSDHKDILKHSFNYLAATVATRALSFISVPVYTYLLTVEDYGVMNVFTSATAIVAILLTLNTEVAVGRYYYDSKDTEDFKNFVGTSVRLNMIVFCIMSVLLLIGSGYISNYLGIERLLTIAFIPFAFFGVLNSIFQQIYQPLLKSKKIAIVSSVQAYSTFGLSIIYILFLDEKKYYGLVWGSMTAMLFFGTYSFKQITVYCNKCFNTRHVKYILNYSIPYLPYSLSSLIIATFGKLIIGQQQGFESAGLYSFAQNISSLMLILISVVHSTWNPYYFTYMNKKEYSKIRADYNIIWRITLFCAVVLSFFGGEIGILLGRPEYTKQLYLIPIFMIGYCFFQWSYVYMRNVGYEKKVIWNAVIVIGSGLVNILANVALIDFWGPIGVALSFAFSYLVMAMLGWLINHFILKSYVPPIQMFLFPLLVAFAFIGISLLFPYSELSVASIFRKVMIVIVAMFLLSYGWWFRIWSMIYQFSLNMLCKGHNN